MGSFPQVDPRYGKVLASRQVPREEWNEHQKWVRYFQYLFQQVSFLAVHFRSNPGDTLNPR